MQDGEYTRERIELARLCLVNYAITGWQLPAAGVGESFSSRSASPAGYSRLLSSLEAVMVERDDAGGTWSSAG